MSWFDATGLANIAKTALKEAQKTIDKALDIKDEEDEADNDKIKTEDSFNSTNEKTRISVGEKVKEEIMPTSSWGSFTGSFFQVDNSSVNKESLLISKQPQKFTLSLSSEKKAGAPLATPENDVTPTETIERINKEQRDEGSNINVNKKNENVQKKNEWDGISKDILAIASMTQNKPGEEVPNIFSEEKVITRPKGRRNSSNRNSYVSNRLSVLSTESEGKKSSDSVEVLGSLSCTTSPDTDLPSISASSSSGLPVSSSCTDSVEVINSLASPSSIEVIVDGTGSGRTTQSSCINSSKENLVNHSSVGAKLISSPNNSLNDVSPESFEVIPDLPEYDEELSVADSYTSASESTGPTVLEPSYQYSYRMTESFTDLSQASSKFRSGDSTPDINTKLPLMNKSSCDILSESIHEVPTSDMVEFNQNTSAQGKSETMGEISATRETSPTLSEKSRSDLVKVGSEQTSGHTSGDELETTTSSDIEIISRYSPNGDSSSTTSRHSPAKLLHHNSKSKLSLVSVDILGKATQTKIKGHQREPSEASSFCSEDNSSEVEKLSKRVTELTEILEARESRLNDLRKSNLDIQEKNQELKKELEMVKLGVISGVSASQADSEKDKIIKELKEEGEKLSKKELKQATLIKTLRAQEKSQQALIENNKTQIQTLTKALDECRAELLAKKDIEKTLNESVKQMNKKITRQDEEIANLMNQMEKAVIKAEELNYLLEAKETELKKCKEILAAEDFELQDAKSIAELKTKQLERLKLFQESAEIELEDLRQQLKKAEEMHSEREKANGDEKKELMRRLQEAEGRNEELAQSVSKATRPLLRQMEALQATTAHERATWEKQERNLLQKLEEAESHLSSVTYHEKSYKQENLELRTKLSNLEEKLQISNQESATWKYQVSSLSKQLQEAKQTIESDKQSFEKEKESFKSQINELKGDIMALEHQLSVERTNVEVERRRAAMLQEQIKDRETHPANRGDSNSPRSSPTLSFGRVSLSESLSSNVWPQFCEDGFETASVSGRCSNVYDNLRAGNTASLVENLQAQLKMRDGEISQLQWELQRRDTERSVLTTELSSLTSKLEETENKLSQAEAVGKNLKEVQTNYDALLEMYGEKVEEVEELRLDLQDVKEMYKSQIDQLLKKEKQDVPS